MRPMKFCSRLIILLFVIVATHPLQGRDVSLRVDNPADAVAAANKATELERKGDLDGAIGYYTAAFKIDPRCMSRSIVAAPFTCGNTNGNKPWRTSTRR